ncbi:hypothetical protein EDB84DRAFT_1646685, partial [Lactarius hengduanensis]
SLESDLQALQVSHLPCVGTAILFHHPRSRPPKPGLVWLTRKWPGCPMQDRGPGGYDFEEDAHACVDLLKTKIKNNHLYNNMSRSSSRRIMILECIARSPRALAGQNGVRTAIGNPGNPVALHGTSATPPATTVACANDVEIVDELLGALDSHEFVFGRPTGLADTLRDHTPRQA